jgi:hypothetical protein
MRARDRVKYGAVGAATLVVATAILLPTGWGQAAAATVPNVFITNKGATQAVPVTVTNGSVTVSTTPHGSTAWWVDTACATACIAFAPPAGKSTLALTSLTSSNGDTTSKPVEVDISNGTSDSSSANFQHVIIFELLAAFAFLGALFQPLVVAPGGSNWVLCLTDTATTGTSTFVGYYY